MNIPKVDIIAGDGIWNAREGAKQGDIFCMARLGCYIYNGIETRKNDELALELFNYSILHKEKIECHQTYWNVLLCKAYIHCFKEQYQEAEEMYIELIKEIASSPPELWNHVKIITAAGWLEHFKSEREATLQH